LCIFIDETKELGKKTCKQYVRGCRAQLSIEYPYSACTPCLEKDRAKDRARRATAKETIPDEAGQTCNSCCSVYEASQFIGVSGGMTKTCAKCRESNRIQDQKRDKDHRNELSRIAERAPERLAKKTVWKEANYEKVAMYGMNHRQRKIEEDIDGYLERNAGHAKQWRENNPEKVKITNENKINSRKSQYCVYQRSAGDKGFEFSISQDSFDQIVNGQCYYCGVMQDRGFNGIDRMNSSIGYVIENCVSCCKICNYMKGSLSVDVFVKRIEHILTFNCKVNGRYFPDEYCEYNAVSYNEYKRRANEKHIDFEITISDYDSFVNSNCYLCDRGSYDKCKNGIDRVDNTKGYVLSNVKPCCGSCNYMKKDLSLDVIFNKWIEIYNNNVDISTTPNVMNDADGHGTSRLNTMQLYRNKLKQTIGIDEFTKFERELKQTQCVLNVKKNINKKTDDEKREAARIRKQTQREKIKEKYGNEEYKIMKAKEMAEYRQSKKDK
jgi:hypothetical protein